MRKPQRIERAGTKELARCSKEYLAVESLRNLSGSGKKGAKSKIDRHSQFYEISTENALLPLPKKRNLFWVYRSPEDLYSLNRLQAHNTHRAAIPQSYQSFKSTARSINQSI